MEDKTLVVSTSKAHGRGKGKSLLRKLEDNSIPVLSTITCWPRDEFHFHKNGKIDHVQKETSQNEYLNHEAWNGGAYLKGKDFLIGSATAMSEEKRKETEKVLGVNKGHYFDISTELDSLIHINIGGKKNFFESGFPHIDNIYNLGNHQNVLFTYDHPNLRRKGQEIGEKIGHELIALPLEEASYASVGFVEFGHNAIVDRRAKKTQKILEDSGYNVIKTPHSLKETNKRGGSLRCMTNEIPIRKERFETLNPNNMEDKYRRMSLENNFLFTSKGEAVIESDALKLKVKD